jgi:regulator of protease activity HflC (stomatin/prohibitin superfamily)
MSIVTSLAVLGLIGAIGYIALNASRGRPTRTGVVGVVIAIILLLILLPLNAGLVLVQPNEIGVVFRQTGSGDAALREPISPGLKWVVPFIDVVEIYEISQQSVTMADSAIEGGVPISGAVRAISADGQVIIVDVTVIFRVDPLRINEIHRSWRKTYVDGYIVAQTRSEVRNAISEYGAEQIYSGGRAALEAQITAELREKMDREGFILTDVLIRNISFSQEFTDAIEQKQIAEQEAQRAVFLVQIAEQQAQQAVAEAQGRADSVVIEAQGEAQAIIIRAQAESEGLALVNEVLAENPSLIQWQYINQLGDQVELIIIPSNTPFLFDLQQLLEAAGAEQVDSFEIPPTGGQTSP